MEIRVARREDLQQLLDIYNYEVVHGVATLDLRNHPLLVAEQAGRVAGYASLSPYRSKEAYRSTVELSIYIGPDFRRQGVATALMEAILREARQDPETHTVVSVITDGNEASRKLHEKFGFTYCGAIREVGMKFGAYQDILNFSLIVS